MTPYSTHYLQTDIIFSLREFGSVRIKCTWSSVASIFVTADKGCLNSFMQSFKLFKNEILLAYFDKYKYTLTNVKLSTKSPVSALHRKTNN